MTPSLNKCPRCGTLRPSGEVAHTCVVVAPQATVSMDDENLSRAYLDLVAREQRAVEFLQIIANWERTFDDPGAQAMADRIDAFLAERGEV